MTRSDRDGGKRICPVRRGGAFQWRCRQSHINARLGSLTAMASPDFL
jgi:hypothetical protein